MDRLYGSSQSVAGRRFKPGRQGDSSHIQTPFLTDKHQSRWFSNTVKRAGLGGRAFLRKTPLEVLDSAVKRLLNHDIAPMNE
jgi:hypothetical protein